MWAKHTKDQWILRTVKKGLRVNISKGVQRFIPKECVLGLDRVDQREWMEKVIAWKAIERVDSDDMQAQSEIVSSLVFEKKKGRICANLNILNRAVNKLPLRMESLREVKNRFQPKEWLLKLDLSKFYWSLLIRKKYRKLFRFYIEGQKWQWRALPFGFSNSMQIMHRLMEPLMNKLRQCGVRVLKWVDDIVLCCGTDYKMARRLATKSVRIVCAFGWLINLEKSSKTLTKCVPYRGFEWNTESEVATVPQEKVVNIRHVAKELLSQEMISSRQLSSLVGKIRYISQLDHSILIQMVEVEIWRKQTFRQGGWDTRFVAPHLVIMELEKIATSFRVSPIPLKRTWTLRVQGDAGPFGFGFGEPRKAAGVWSPLQRLHSTNWRELKTWAIFIDAFLEDLKGISWIYETDSIVAASYINRVLGKSDELSRLSAGAWAKLTRAWSFVKAVVVDQEMIHESDRLSRLIEKGSEEQMMSFERSCVNLGILVIRKSQQNSISM